MDNEHMRKCLTTGNEEMQMKHENNIYLSVRLAEI